MAQIRRTEERVQELLKGLPGLMPAEREKVQKSIQCELQRASKALETLALEEAMGGPETPMAADVPEDGTADAATPSCTY